MLADSLIYNTQLLLLDRWKYKVVAERVTSHCANANTDEEVTKEEVERRTCGHIAKEVQEEEHPDLRRQSAMRP